MSEEHAVVRPIGEAVSQQSKSLFDELKDEHAGLSEKRTKVFDMPGRERLAVRYKAIGLKMIEKYQRRAAKDDSELATIHCAADILAACCDEILVYDDEGNPQPLIDQEECPDRWGDDPIRYDERLVEALGIEGLEPGSKNRIVVESVFKVFEPDTGNDIAMMDHGDDVVKWIKSGARGSDEDF
jgi:hypothetical protein